MFIPTLPSNLNPSLESQEEEKYHNPKLPTIWPKTSEVIPEGDHGLTNSIMASPVPLWPITV